jgi:glycosyltransferase involved in cell wall biosynthesis
VSLTPIAMERDSRTFKQATSIARLGHESIAIEGVESSLDRGVLAFELITASVQPPRLVNAGLLRRALAVLRRGAYLASPNVVNAVTRLWRFGPRTARSVPPAALYYLHAPHQYLAMWVRSRGRTPFVYDAHDFYPAGYSVAPGEALWIRALIWLERRCVRHASAVVTVTEGCADLIEDYFGRRPAVVRNVHDPRIDEPVPRDLRKELGLGARDFLVVMAGNAKAGTAVD